MPTKMSRRKDGLYETTFSSSSGRVHFYGKTQAEANAKKRAFIDNEKAGLVHKPVSVQEYASNWLHVHKASVSDKCYNDYASQMNKMISVIGCRAIASVKPSDAKSVYNEYLGYSESTIHRARMLYVAMFDSAIEDGYLHINPFRSKTSRPHQGTRGTHRAITAEERQLILTTPHRFQLGALVMLYAGLRRGETIAIDIDRDIDIGHRLIHIGRAVRFDSNQPILSDPKTDAGTRDVPILDILLPYLADHHGFVMQSAHGQQLTETAFRRGWDSYMTALSAAAGHPVSIRCHDLRHSFCTMLRDNGIDMHLAMRWMGHADEKMILRVYDHIDDTRVQNAVKTLDDYTSCRKNCRNALDV